MKIDAPKGPIKVWKTKEGTTKSDTSSKQFKAGKERGVSKVTTKSSSSLFSKSGKNDNQVLADKSSDDT